MTEQNLYRQTMKRLKRSRVNTRDEKAVVLFLAEEIEYYRDKIKYLEQLLNTNILYQCDCGKCEPCDYEMIRHCGYTTDIRHAKNFELQHNAFLLQDAFVETSPLSDKKQAAGETGG